MNKAPIFATAALAIATMPGAVAAQMRMAAPAGQPQPGITAQNVPDNANDIAAKKEISDLLNAKNKKDLKENMRESISFNWDDQSGKGVIDIGQQDVRVISKQDRALSLGDAMHYQLVTSDYAFFNQSQKDANALQERYRKETGNPDLTIINDTAGQAGRDIIANVSVNPTLLNGICAGIMTNKNEFIKLNLTAFEQRVHAMNTPVTPQPAPAPAPAGPPQ